MRCERPQTATLPVQHVASSIAICREKCRQTLSSGASENRGCPALLARLSDGRGAARSTAGSLSCTPLAQRVALELLLTGGHSHPRALHRAGLAKGNLTVECALVLADSVLG